MSSAVGSTVPAHLRMIDSHVPSIEGIRVVFNNTYRTGALMLETGTSERPGQITCSAATLSWLDATEQHGGREWGIVANVLRNEIRDAGVAMVASKMIDLTTKGHKVVDRRKVTRPSNDRIDHMVKGISDLVAQMSAILGGHVERTPELVASTAKRYAELAAEIKQLRELLTGAEGQFDIAQIQVMQLMGDELDG